MPSADGSEPTTRVEPLSTPWDGQERTVPLVAGGDEPTPLLAGPRRWQGAEATMPLGASLPQAHLQITSQFAPFAAARRKAPAAERKQPATDHWHTLGRQGPLTGQVFGDYELGTVLGEGGMGIIYRARQRSLGRRVAVKTLAAGVAQDPVQRGRFELEARAASLVRSPHVVQVHAAGSHNDTAYFVMEYVEGTNLGLVIQERGEEGGTMPPDAAAGWILQAAKGLAAAAEHAIVHRDIKPANLLISREGVLKIADFGISRIQGESNLTRTGTAIGTPSYVSPEQGRGEVCDARADLYSLGVVFYECLTGRKPFTGDTPNAVIYQHSYAEPKLPREIDPRIPEHWQAVVLKCLQKDPARRYQNAVELAADLERIIAGNLSITAVFNAKYGTGADEAMRRYLGRGRRWLAPTVAALLAVSLAGGGGLWWWQVRADERAATRRDLERLRTELRASLDAAQPLPASATADVERIAALAGGQDPDVIRWREKIARVGTLTARLGRLDQATLADAGLAGDSRADLDALTALVGETYPGIDRWRRRLQDTAAEIARLRLALGVLDRSAGISLAQREELATDLGRFTSLAGEQDADLVRWRARIAATDARLAALAGTLAELDEAKAQPTEARILQLGAVLDEYLALRGAGHIDEQAARWKALIDARRAHLAALRASLARLDEVAVVSDGTRARLDKELAEYTGLVGADDVALGRWRRLLADSERAIGVLRGRCAVLDQADALPQAQLDAARADLETLRPLVAGDDAQVRRWSAALAAIDDRRTQDEAALAVLAADAPVSLAQQARAEQAIESLDARGLLGEDAKIACRRRIIAEQERVAALKRSLAVADDPHVETTPGLVDGVLLYGRLAGTEDADYKRWYAHVIRAVQVREALAPLDRAAPVPERARELLTEYVAILGDDERARSWRGKVDRVADLRRSLAPLDRPAPVPDDGLERLDELLALIGPFPGSDSWRIKLTAIRELRGNLAHELAPTAVRLAPDARAHLASLGALIGVEDERMRIWNRRLAWLAGPGQPAWATRYAVDAAGPRALLAVPGEPAVEIEFRYVPPGRFTMGSPGDEPGRDADEPQVEVTLTKGYWLAVYEARQDLWQRITGRNPSMDEDPAGPVDRVSWDDVQAFLAAFNTAVPGVNARLPTEAEWEHAARAGEDGPYHGPFGAATPESLPRLAWFAGGEDPGDGVRSAGRRQPNALGLHDLQGNVWEWCQDRYGYYSPVPVTDPLGFEREERVLRGGSWGDPAERIRVANRLALGPDFRSWYVGFRLAITAEMPPEVRLDRNEARGGEEPERILIPSPSTLIVPPSTQP